MSISRRHALRLFSGAFIAPTIGTPRSQPTYGLGPGSADWARFIIHYPAFWSRQPAIAKAAPSLWGKLHGAIAAFPNSNYRPEASGDTWQPASPYGDCEDLAIARMGWLVEHGVEIGALRPTVSQWRDGQWDCLLSVVTDDGDYILDTKVSRPRLWFEADYNWYARLLCQNNWERLTP